jgi:hypothetical protein
MTKSVETNIDRPAVVSEEHLVYLDELRDRGATNMFGARPYLMEDFPELSGEDAKVILSYWMKSFSARQTK